MPSDHPDAVAIRRLYEAFNTRDITTLTEAFERTLYHVPGENSIAGIYSGPEEIFGLMAKSLELTGGTLRFELEDVVANGHHAVALDRATASRGDRKLDMARLMITHLENGKPLDLWLVVQDQYAFDEFWS